MCWYCPGLTPKPPAQTTQFLTLLKWQEEICWAVPPRKAAWTRLDCPWSSGKDTLPSLTACGKILSSASASSQNISGFSTRGALVPHQLQGKAATYWTPGFVACNICICQFLTPSSDQILLPSSDQILLLLQGMCDGQGAYMVPTLHWMSSLALAKRCNFSSCCKH